MTWSFNPLSEKELNEKEEEYEARNALVAVVRALRERVASKAKDKSFSMAGILERLGVLLKPDKPERSLGDVYHELFAQLLRREPSLIALLVDADGSRERQMGVGESENVLDEAPSWVPNWSQLRKRHWIDYDETIYQRIQLGTSPSSPATTSVPAHGAGSQEWRLCWVDDGHNPWALNVQTVILCRITWVSSPIGSTEFRSLPPHETIPTQHLRKYLTIIDAWLSAVKLCEPYFNPTAIFRILYPFEQQPPRAKPTPGIYGGHRQEGQRGIVHDHFKAWNNILNGPESEYRYTREAREYLIDEVLRNPEAKTFTNNVCERFAGDTRLFISQDEGFIGKGSQGMQNDDVVALIRGVGQPMVLRRTSPRSRDYMVVGPAFACRLADVNTFRMPPRPESRDGAGYNPEKDRKEWTIISLV